MFLKCLLMASLQLASTTCLAETKYRLIDPEPPRSSSGNWKKPLGITIIVVGSVVGGLFALYSLGTAPICDENYEEGSPERKDCEDRSNQAFLGFFGGLALAGASIAGGVVLIKMARRPQDNAVPLTTNNHDLAVQWTYAF
jgi:hypothetical protein